ncbi:lasso peptide biosynthesis PqqD family chaperone [Amycolatopsis minnesotensis]|uniref:Coenzyme PQQ synthesis protein D (PqqD) n=1 Tax=Amycolatopsis minnesotensis TaxID=337894 RepID=A0ABN2R4J4_9PSEU
MSPRLRPDITTTDTGDGTVLLDERTGRYWQLNPTGAQVLDALLSGQRTEQIAARLAAENHLDTEQALRDVTALADRLHAANLVVRS